MITSIVLVLSVLGLFIGMALIPLSLIFTYFWDNMKYLLLLPVAAILIGLGSVGCVASQVDCKYFYPQSYDIKQMAIDYDAEIKREGRIECLKLEKSLDGDKWTYYIPEPDPYSDYKVKKESDS